MGSMPQTEKTMEVYQDQSVYSTCRVGAFVRFRDLDHDEKAREDG